MQKAFLIPYTTNFNLSAEEFNLREFVVATIPSANTLQPMNETEKLRTVARTMATTTMTVGTLKIALVDVRILDIDQSYQHFKLRNAFKLINIYDLDKTGIIELSYRDEKLYVIDGCRRIIGAIVNGHRYILAAIHTDWTREQEAEEFRRQNDHITSFKPKPIELFYAGLITNDPTDVAIKNICDKYHLTISKGTKDVTNPMTAIASARQVVNEHGGDATVLDWTFGLMNSSHWIDYPNCVTSKALFAFAKVYDSAIENNTLDIVRMRLLAVMLCTTPHDYDKLTHIVYKHEEARTAMNALTADIANGVRDCNSLLLTFKGERNLWVR